MYVTIRRALLRLAHTPLHPQWFSFTAKRRAAELIVATAPRTLLDIGSADNSLGLRLPVNCRYVGLDHPLTGRELYGARPDVFGDAANLPFRAASFDAIALLDVLEHLREPRASLEDVCRVLKPGGTLYVHVPYMYPLHDEPHDYQRPTIHGLRHWIQDAGLRVIGIEAQGAPPETVALLTNIALAHAVARTVGAFAPAVLLAVLIAPLIPIVNLLGWTLGRFNRKDSFMPLAYWATACRNDEHPPWRSE